MSEKETWQERLKKILGPGGYADSYMRRSMQTVVLYEAMRCIQPHLEILRPFQKRALLWMQVHKLLDSLDFLTPQQKKEVLWRTQKKGEHLNDESAWSRAKTNEKYLRKTVQEIGPFIVAGQSHQQAVDAMVRQAYHDSLASKSNNNDASVASTINKSSIPPRHWEFFHNHTILALRLYYDGEQLIDDIPRMEPDVAMVPLQRQNPKETDQKPHATKKVTKSLKIAPAASFSPAVEVDAHDAYRPEHSADDIHNESENPASCETIDTIRKSHPETEKDSQQPKRLVSAIKNDDEEEPELKKRSSERTR